MANSLECHFSQIDATPARTEVTVNIYSMQDLGLVDGAQQWSRTLVQDARQQNPFKVILDAGIPAAQIVTALKAKLAAINTQFALGYSAANQLCTL